MVAFAPRCPTVDGFVQSPCSSTKYPARVSASAITKSRGPSPATSLSPPPRPKTRGRCPRRTTAQMMLVHAPAFCFCPSPSRRSQHRAGTARYTLFLQPHPDRNSQGGSASGRSGSMRRCSKPGAGERLMPTAGCRPSGGWSLPWRDSRGDPVRGVVRGCSCRPTWSATTPDRQPDGLVAQRTVMGIYAGAGGSSPGSQPWPLVGSDICGSSRRRAERSRLFMQPTLGHLLALAVAVPSALAGGAGEGWAAGGTVRQRQEGWQAL